MNWRTTREQYWPSGRFNGRRMFLVLVLLPAVAGSIAALYFGMLSAGAYVSALSVMFPAAAATGFARWAIRYASCRNRVLAGVLGATCGLAGYVTYFHVDQVVRWKAPIAAVDRLPDYIAFRMDTDSWRWASKAALLEPLPPAAAIQPVGRRAGAPVHWMNWGLFVFEALVLAIAPAAAGIHSASRPYSERRGDWYECESLFVEPAQGQRLREALESGTINQWIAQLPRLISAAQPHCKVTLWYTSNAGEGEADLDVLLSIGNRRPWQLEITEAAAFVRLLPSLQRMVGISPESAAPSSLDDLTVARIWPVPAAHAGNLYTAWRRDLRVFGQKARLFGPPLLGMAALVGGTPLLWFCLAAPGIIPHWIMPVYVAGLGFPLWIYSQYRLRFENIWRHHLQCTYDMVCETIASRPDAIVQVGQPGVIYAEWCPRSMWEAGRKPRPDESNEGLLRFDFDRQIALFEGENQRVVLPAESIVQAHIEALPGVPANVEGLYCVVIRVQTDTGSWELPLFPLGGLAADTNGDRAILLLRMFDELVGTRSFADETDWSAEEPAAEPH